MNTTIATTPHPNAAHRREPLWRRLAEISITSQVNMPKVRMGASAQNMDSIWILSRGEPRRFAETLICKTRELSSRGLCFNSSFESMELLESTGGTYGIKIQVHFDGSRSFVELDGLSGILVPAENRSTSPSSVT